MFRDLRALIAFAHVVEARSFSGAAERLGITKSAVSKLIQNLEGELGVQLLVRTTRKLSLTEVGEAVYAACGRLAEDVEAAREAAAAHHSVIVGQIRATAPAVLGRKYLIPVVVEFLAEHPKVGVDLDLRDAYVDLVEGRFDVAFRVARAFADSTLVVRRLADVRVIACASPRYLGRHGRPRAPGDLAKHAFIQHRPTVEPNRVTFHKGKNSVTVKVNGRFACNDGAATVVAAALGEGIVVAPEFEVSDDIARGRLVPILEGWKLDELSLAAVFPPQRRVPAKVRALIELVAERWGKEPWRSG